MVERDEPDRIDELDALRAPPRSAEARRAARDRILAGAELLLARRRRSRSSLDVLATWGRPGLVAASVALAILAGALQPWRGRAEPTQPIALEEVLRGAAEGDGVPALLVAINEPDADAVVAAALLARNGNGASVPENVERR